MNNDRFKFRVWDNKENRYAYEYEFYSIDEDGEVELGERVCGEWATYSGDEIDVVVEQCTGLKDQSGKLIFEGDVVDYYAPMADDHYQGVVTFDDNETTASGYYIKGKCKGWQSYLDGPYCRIIGNVHQMEDSGNENN